MAILSGGIYSWENSRTYKLQNLVELMFFHSEKLLWFLNFFTVFFRLSVNQITDSGVKVLYEELTKYKILTFLGYVFLKNTGTAM